MLDSPVGVVSGHGILIERREVGIGYGDDLGTPIMLSTERMEKRGKFARLIARGVPTLRRAASSVSIGEPAHGGDSPGLSDEQRNVVLGVLADDLPSELRWSVNHSLKNANYSRILTRVSGGQSSTLATWI